MAFGRVIRTTKPALPVTDAIWLLSSMLAPINGNAHIQGSKRESGPQLESTYTQKNAKLQNDIASLTVPSRAFPVELLKFLATVNIPR